MHVIAIDWNSTSARAAVALRRPAGAELLGIASLDAVDSPQSLAEKIKQAFPEIRWPKVRFVVALGGEQVSFRLLTLPPAPEQELPDLVRLAAERELGGDGGVIDFVPLEGDANTPHKVLVARITAQTKAAVESLAEMLGATSVTRIVLRASSAASLVARMCDAFDQTSTLVVSPAGSMIDMAVYDQSQPRLLRTARKGSESDHDERGSEVRRTLSSAAVQIGNPISRTWHFGNLTAEETALVDQLGKRWKLPHSDRQLIPQTAGVVGAALDEVERMPPIVDFANPRKASIDTTPRKRLAIYGGLVTAIVLGGAFLANQSLARADAEIERLNALVKQDQQAVEKLAPLLKQVAAVDQWKATDINWLDELELLCRRMRPEPLESKEFQAENDVVLMRLTANSSQGRRSLGGALSLDAIARLPETSTLLEDRISDDQRRVAQGPLDQTGKGKYPWRLKPTIRVTPSVAEEMP